MLLKFRILLEEISLLLLLSRYIFFFVGMFKLVEDAATRATDLRTNNSNSILVLLEVLGSLKMWWLCNLATILWKILHCCHLPLCWMPFMKWTYNYVLVLRRSYLRSSFPKHSFCGHVGCIEFEFVFGTPQYTCDGICIFWYLPLKFFPYWLTGTEYENLLALLTTSVWDGPTLTCTMQNGNCRTVVFELTGLENGCFVGNLDQRNPSMSEYTLHRCQFTVQRMGLLEDVDLNPFGESIVSINKYLKLIGPAKSAYHSLKLHMKRR